MVNWMGKLTWCLLFAIATRVEGFEGGYGWGTPNVRLHRIDRFEELFRVMPPLDRELVLPQQSQSLRSSPPMGPLACASNTPAKIYIVWANHLSSLALRTRGDLYKAHDQGLLHLATGRLPHRFQPDALVRAQLETNYLNRQLIDSTQNRPVYDLPPKSIIGLDAADLRAARLLELTINYFWQETQSLEKSSGRVHATYARSIFLEEVISNNFLQNQLKSLIARNLDATILNHLNPEAERDESQKSLALLFSSNDPFYESLRDRIRAMAFNWMNAAQKVRNVGGMWSKNIVALDTTTRPARFQTRYYDDLTFYLLLLSLHRAIESGFGQIDRCAIAYAQRDQEFLRAVAGRLCEISPEKPLVLAVGAGHEQNLKRLLEGVFGDRPKIRIVNGDRNLGQQPLNSLAQVVADELPDSSILNTDPCLFQK